MWDSIRLSAKDSFTLRKIAMLMAAVFISALFTIVANSTTTFAETASWNGDAISYGGKTYSKVSDTLPGIDADSDAYVAPVSNGKVDVISIPSGSDNTSDISNAKLYTYNYDDQTNVYSSPGPPSTLAISANPVDASGSDEGSDENKTSCAVTGVGWIICSVSRWIAEGMDHVFNLISGFLVVRPLTTETDSGMYQAWEIARNLANASFIVAFLLIIYAQISTYGMSNYEIKKMIPRLIIAAFLVNVSYYICTIAVDVSNILGDSIQQALVQIRQSLPAPMPGGSVVNWKSMTEFLLSGGTVVGAGLAGYAAFTGAIVGGSMTGLVILLFPILVAGILSVLIALIVLAARQAIITVLVIISPLAFVAFLLPNTEKYFERWRKLLITMLLVFPMFSLLYGGSQLASYLVIQNTDQISVMLLAMFIQVAPLALTPFLVRFSGSLMGQLAGMLNKPRGALVGQARNFAKDRSSMQAAKGQMAAANRQGTYFQRRAFRRALDSKDREGYKKGAEAMTDAVWHNDSRYRRHHYATSVADRVKRAGETSATRHFEEHAARDRALNRLDGRRRENEEAIKLVQTQQDYKWQEMKSRNMTKDNVYKEFAPTTRTISEQQRVAEGRVAAAQAQQKIEFANDLIASPTLQMEVGGIASHGAQRALASAVSEYRKDYNSKINEANAILQHFNLSSDQRQRHALGEEVWVKDDEGRMMALRADSLFTREAAIETQMKIGRYKEAEQILQMSGKELNKFRTTISSAMAEGGLSKKAVFTGGSTIDRTAQGQITSFDDLMTIVLESIAKGKVSANDLANNEDHAIKRMFEVVTEGRQRYEANLSDDDRNKLDESIKRLIINAKSVLSNPQVGSSLKGSSRDELIKISSLGEQFGISDADIPTQQPTDMPPSSEPEGPDTTPDTENGNA